MRRVASVLCSSLLFLQIGSAFAQDEAPIFPDVPNDHLYREAIEALVGAQVINGNPDGNFYPERSVNRAEMLKMLYRAKGRTPDPTSKDCFSDVESGSWYESYVCDAAANRFVEGYNDGTFRPANVVNRVEAIKMITQIFGISVADVTEADRDIVKFVDVSTAAWYTKYLAAAFLQGILPIPGMNGARFYPDWPLLRGEAAAYIFNALRVQLNQSRSQQSSRSSVPAQESSGPTENQPAASSSSYRAPLPQPTTQEVLFPFETSGKFSGKASASYTFTLAKSAVVLTQVALTSGQHGSVSCRLYLIEETGFSLQYFLGFVEGSKCTLKTALKAGKYQLQLQPTSPDTTFTVSAKETTGDGKDGFIQAVKVKYGEAKTEALTENDYQDWFSFTVGSPKSMTLSLSNAAQLSCMVYAMGDVDLYGFDSPDCNKTYQYPVGTYYVAIGRKLSSMGTITYSVQLR
ncbi:MAG: S-layer homology domain-containing protein [Candidatus Peregrinibacteria bacterium]